MIRRFARKAALPALASALAFLSIATLARRDGQAQKAAASPAATARPNQLPLIEDVPIRDWSVGKPLYFGIHALDPDDDDITIELVDKPASATYNALTQTVSWKPTAKDGVEGRFRVRVTENNGILGAIAPRAVTRDFAIRLGKTAAMPQPQLQSPAQEMLVTVHDPARLAVIKKTWSLAKMLTHVGNLEVQREVLAGKKAADYGVPKPEATLNVILGLMAKLHGNPALNPDSETFDKRWELKNWDLVTIRPRMNKKRHELRVVYKNMAAPETNYIMFRLAIASDMPDVPMDVRTESNQEFSRLLYEAFFTGETLNPKLVTDKKAYAKALDGFLNAVLNYKNEKFPRLYSQILALPNAGRLGGGSVQDKGVYKSGNGWAWLTFKNTWVDENGKKMASYFGPPIKGFSGEIANENGAWTSKCIPELDVSLCRKAEGFTNMPASDPHSKNPDGTVKAALLDAQHTNKAYKKLMQKKTRLDDGTRRNFEENGMSCAQCHVRAFDEGDVLDPGIWDPKQKPLGSTLARPLPQTFFVLVPETGHSPFLLAQARDAECQLGPTLQKDIGKKVSVPCPHQP